MAGAKLIVMYPTPRDMQEFERAYNDEHLPMLAPAFRGAGVSKGVFTKIASTPAGAPAFHRIAEIHFTSLEKLQACAASKGGQDVLVHARKISSGGPPVVMIAEEEEDVVTY